MSVSNILAYFDTATISAIKSFIVQALAGIMSMYAKVFVASSKI
jgi:hypothetical protein